MNFELRQKLEQVARRMRSLRLWTVLALCWLFWAIVGVVIYGRSNGETPTGALGWRELAILAGVSAVIGFIAVVRSARDQRAVARRVEARHPDLGTLLLTALEASQLPRKRLGYLQATVIRDAVAHGRRHNWASAVSPWKLRFARLAGLTALGLLIGVCIGLGSRAGAHGNRGGSRAPAGELRDVSFDIKVDPGNTEIERGTSLVVVAEFGAAVPPEATLVVSTEADAQQSDAMARSLEDPKFVGRVAAVENDLSYHVEFAGRRSETYRVTVFEYPELVRADAKLVFPDYAAMEPAIIEDVRHLTAVEGTRLTLAFRLNKPVATAQLVESGADPVHLEQHPKEAAVYRTSWTLDESRRYKLQLEDEAGRRNRLPAEIVVNVTPNRPPKIEFQRPARDVEVSPLEELHVKAAVSDDFGVTAQGLTYTFGGATPQDVPLATATQPAKKLDIAHVIEFETLKAQPDQLLSYFIWAEDIGPDGKPRRTASDMYFAEVRPFEEIYRQGEQPAQNQQQQAQQQGGGNAQEAAELAELQKQIINATWKLVRRETRPPTSDEFPADSRLVEESQQSAIERLSQLAQRLQDSESLAHVETARGHMEEAVKQLSSATEKRATEPLRPALSAEQAAYQALLKLRAREFQVVRGGQQQQGGGAARGGSRSQRQLDQLELRADENRYETQSRATNPEETAAQRQSREILNRLRDLARRQEDLNERLRELQSALEQAQTEQEREEIKRELKRLRDQQEQILRDTDELASRMDRQGSQPQSQEARQQLEESRSHVQQASEALEEGQLSQALTEGTRAERELSELRDDFRRQAANRFSEEMTEMRRAARNLDERQQQLSEQLSEQQAGPGRSLRDTGPRAEVAEGLADQREQLGNLLERMRETIEEAEEPEPLLSQQLYDTVRETHHQRVENALDVARRLAEVGIEREAGRAMRAADEGITRLREGVERAAESVLGDETEALRRAKSEVERLAEELNREIENARGGEPSESASQNSNERQAGGNQASDSAPRENEGPGRNAQNEESAGRDPSALPENDPTGRSPQESETGNREDESGRQGGSPGSRPSNRDEPRGEQDDRQQPGGQQGGEQAGGQSPSDGGEQPGNARGQNENSDGSAGGPRGNRQRSPLRGGGRQPSNERGGLERFFERNGGGGLGAPGGPITGEDYRDWADRLRDVEQMLEDEDLRSEAARIRDRAEDARIDFKRHSKMPDWTKLQDLVAEPLVELNRRIDEEIRRSESPDALVPIDRDPIPPEFADEVRRYYERLGGGE